MRVAEHDHPSLPRGVPTCGGANSVGQQDTVDSEVSASADTREVANMVDQITSEARSRNMARVRGKNTEPEMRGRRLLHALGYRFRLHRRDLPGSPDLVFPGRRAVVFVHGCFWHRHEGCRLASTPKSNEAFWQAKFGRNVERDARKKRELQALGWRVLVVWQCETTDAEALAARLQDFLGPVRISGKQL